MISFVMFLLPIETAKTVFTIKDNIRQDLEFDTSNNPYKLLFPKSKLLFDSLKKYYTTDTEFLSAYQKCILRFKNNISTNYDSFFTIWNTLLKETSFLEKYDYIKWKHLQFLNTNRGFLQTIAYYNLSSPLINLSIPILFLLFPFILIRFVMKVPLTFSLYKTLVYKQFQNHAFGKMFTLFSNDISNHQRMIILFSIVFYTFTIYQNVLSCYQFYINSTSIKKIIFECKQHLILSRNHIENLNSYFNYIPFKKWKKHNRMIHDKISRYVALLDSIDNPNFSVKQITTIGSLMELFYTIYHDHEFHEIIQTSFEICDFVESLLALQNLHREKKINLCKFRKRTKLVDEYYMYHMNEKYTVNTIDMSNNYVITGANASGKTTLLKSSLLNILFSQQFGFGFYKKAYIHPYHYFHSYINIPDTCERDSLFQAEAKRCLTMIHDIEKFNDARNFIIFDELYSGTNTEEAVSCAKALLSYINKYNISFMLTTHFSDLSDLNCAKSYYMKTNINSNDLVYTYKCVPGINTIKGGSRVLKALHYPKEILDQLLF